MTATETNLQISNIKSYVNYLICFVILIFLIEIFLCVYIFVERSNSGKEYIKGNRKKECRNESEKILNDPKFCLANGCYTTDRSDLGIDSEYNGDFDSVNVIFLFVQRINNNIERH